MTLLSVWRASARACTEVRMAICLNPNDTLFVKGGTASGSRAHTMSSRRGGREEHVKKVVIVIALLVASALPAAAQPGTAFGAKVGANFANLNFDPEVFDTSTRTALTAGVFATVPVNDRFSFQPEVLFSAQGAKVSDNGSEGTIKLNYLNIPLLANINLSGGENPFSLLVGPQIGFRTSAKIEGEGEEEDLDDDTESTDFGIVAGLSTTIRNIVLDARYTHGLRNISKNVEGEEGEVKNRVFTVSVGIMFR